MAGVFPAERFLIDAAGFIPGAALIESNAERGRILKIAAIDLGSNSFHMVLVETLRGGAFRVIGTDKEMVRLGTRTLSRGKLPASAMTRGLETLRKYKRLAESAGAEKILAVATSAIREATNGEDFLESIGNEL